MAKNRELLDFRYYDMPQKDPVIVFSGEKWKRVYGSTAPGLHFHNIMEIGICREGSGRMVYEHEEIPYKAGAVSFIPANCPHNTVNEPDSVSWWEYIFVDVHSYFHREFREDELFAGRCEEHVNSRYELLRAEDHPDMVRLIDAVILESNREEPYLNEARHSYLMTLLMLLARENHDYSSNQPDESRTRSRQILLALDFIKNHYTEALLTEDLADAVHMSAMHFRRVFQESMNMSPSVYLNMVRIQQACHLLLRTELPVEAIAEQTGFSTLSTFNRNFRSYMEESPLRWRKTHQGNPDSIAGFHIRAHRGGDDDHV